MGNIINALKKLLGALGEETFAKFMVEGVLSRGNSVENARVERIPLRDKAWKFVQMLMTDNGARDVIVAHRNWLARDGKTDPRVVRASISEDGFSDMVARFWCNCDDDTERQATFSWLGSLDRDELINLQVGIEKGILPDWVQNALIWALNTGKLAPEVFEKLDAKLAEMVREGVSRLEARVDHQRVRRYARVRPPRPWYRQAGIWIFVGAIVLVAILAFI